MIQDIATNAIGGLISGIAVMLVTTALSRKQRGPAQNETNFTYGPSNNHVGNNVVNNNLIQIESTITKQVDLGRRQVAATAKDAPSSGSSGDTVYIAGLSLIVAIYLFATHEGTILGWLQGFYIFISAFILGCTLYVFLARRWSLSGAVITQIAVAIAAQIALWAAVEIQRSSSWGSLGRTATGMIRKNGLLQAILDTPSTLIIASLQIFGLALSVFSALCAMQFAILLLAQSRVAGRVNAGKTYAASAWIIRKLGGLKRASVSCVVIASISLLLSTGTAYRGGEWLNDKFGDALIKLEATVETNQPNTKICLEISGILTKSGESVYRLEQQHGRSWEPIGTTLHIHSGDTTPQKGCVTLQEQANTAYRWVDSTGQEKSNVININ